MISPKSSPLSKRVVKVIQSHHSRGNGPTQLGQIYPAQGSKRERERGGGGGKRKGR